MATGRLGVGETLGALNAALGPGDPVWFKETHARHLRERDFLAPRRALQARLGEGQLQRPAVFERVLGAVASYATPGRRASPGPRVLLHCPALRRSPGALHLSQLRAVVVADHLARALRSQGVCVRLVPAVQDPHMSTFLQKLRVNWPTASQSASAETLRNLVLAKLTSAHDQETLPPGVLGRLGLKELVEEQGHGAGYDPNVDKCLVTEDLLSALAELQEAVRHWPEGTYPGLAGAPNSDADSCMVVHLVSCEEEFRQQKLDLLWWKLDDQAPRRQKHLVCGPVKAAAAPGTLSALEYYELRHAQVCTASALKHGGSPAQDPAWTETLEVLTVATIKFEMLSTAPQGQLVLGDSSISTKGTKSGVFVMYNCARLATLFEGYERNVEQGLYPAFPAVESLDFSLLRDEGEWLLLFNSVLPFPDLLSQTAGLACAGPGRHIGARTETVCKFLVQLSMDFSSYYNRVHVLGEPRPHLFGQMFARLQLLRAVREVLHAGLAMLGLPPLSHV
uniref:DALR anticodon binding domain containing 3 n=1 Tax=Chinchilla lanigera TaxID=34839 RepID=A0A8C2VQ55_CHILA